MDDFVVTKLAVDISVNVPREDWIDYLTKYSDIFSGDYIGYWGYGHRLRNGDQKIGWIVLESDAQQVMESRGREAENCFRDKLPMPEGCHLLDETAAIRAYIEGVKKWGVDWFEEKGDAGTYDIAIQLALLGEIRYG